MNYKKISIDKIKTNPNQPRKVFDEESLSELANSIEKDGLFQPILVRQKDDFYEIVQGERRYRACKMLNFTEMSVMIQELNDEDAFHLAVIENIQREQMTPIEEAQAFLKYIQLGYTQEQVANKVSKTRNYVLNRLQLLDLIPELQDMIASKQLSSSHIKPLMSLKNNVARLMDINQKKAFVILQEKFFHEFKSEKKITVKQLNNWINELRVFLLHSIIGVLNDKADKPIVSLDILGLNINLSCYNIVNKYYLNYAKVTKKDIEFMTERTLESSPENTRKSEIYKTYEIIEDMFFKTNKETLKRVWEENLNKENLHEKTLEQITDEIKKERENLQKVLEANGRTEDEFLRDMSIIVNNV